MCRQKAACLAQLAGGLEVKKDHVFAIELERQPGCEDRYGSPRRTTARPVQLRGDPHHSAFVLVSRPQSPFDDEFGGGVPREVKFLRQAVDLVVPGGASWSRSARSIRSSGCEPDVQGFSTLGFDQLELYLFPDECRSYRE